ncbi:MAG: helix-turn-helix domain-containing protein [Sphingomonadaceae bacterium]|nr:helix-turn-helix domain-containing protein [Sphingomonadaceae bacterium]
MRELRIGDLARTTGISVETVRYYERIGLMPPPGRTAANYRAYEARHLERLNFIRHARSLGFDIAEIRSLLALTAQPATDCAAADAIASRHLAAVEAKIASLEALRAELTRFAGQCRGGTAADCRVLEVLADHAMCGSEHLRISD